MDQVQTSMVVFAVGAVVINVLIYGGIAWTYFSDKRRVDPPNQVAAPAHTLGARQAEARARELHEAA